MFRSLAAIVLLLGAAAAGAQSLFGVASQGSSTTSSVIEIGGDNFPPNVLLTVPANYGLVAFDPFANRMFLASPGLQGSLYVADLQARTIVKSPFLYGGASLAFDETTRRLYAIRGLELLTVDPVSGAEAVQATLPRELWLRAIDGARHRAYVTERGDTATQSLHLLDLDTHALTAIMPVGVNDKVVVDTNGDVIVFHAGPNFSIGAVERVDPLTHARQTIAASLSSVRYTQPAFDPLHRVAYLVAWRDFGLSSVMEFDVATGALREGVLVGGDAVDLAVGAARTANRRRAARH